MDTNRIPVSAIGALATKDSVFIQMGEATVEVKPFIPYAEVLDMIQFCIDWTINDRPFISAPLKQIVHDFAILRFYTNLDISIFDGVHELSDLYSMYDIIKSYEVMEKVERVIDAEQLKFFNTTLAQTLKSINDYRNSAQGIVDTLSDAAKDVNKDMDEAMSLLSDDEKVEKMKTLLHFAEQIKP